MRERGEIRVGDPDDRGGHRSIRTGTPIVTKSLHAYIMYYYQPNKIGADTVHHSAKHSSVLILPVTEGY